MARSPDIEKAGRLAVSGLLPLARQAGVKPGETMIPNAKRRSPTDRRFG